MWHRKLGHTPIDVVHYSPIDCNSFSKFRIFESCTACRMGKMYKLPFKSSDNVYTEPLELIEDDLWGPALVHSSGFS